MSEASVMGVSRASSTAGMCRMSSVESTITSWWSVRRRPDTSRAKDSSLKPVSNPTENVLTGSGWIAAISETTMEESSPPERKAPTGTSATIRRRTESVSRASSCASASAGSDAGWPGSAPNERSQ